MATIGKKIKFDVGEDICKHTCGTAPCKAKKDCDQIAATCLDHDNYISDLGSIVLRQPTNEEWNNYVAAKIEAASGSMKDSRIAVNDVMSEFWDLLVVELKNLEDADGNPIDLKHKDRLHSKEKSGMLVQGLELNNQKINIKN